MIRIRNRWFLLLDVLLCAVTPILALFLRLDVHQWAAPFWRGILIYTVLSLAVKTPVFYRYGLYSRYWRYAGIGDMVAIASATGIAATRLFAVVVVERFLDPFPEIAVPLSVPLIDGLLTLVAIGGSRFSERAVSYARSKTDRADATARKRVLVVGAGDAGSMIVNELQYSDKVSAQAVGFVDDDVDKLGVSIHGIPVLGIPKDIPGLVREHRIDEVIIAIPTAPGRVIREIVELCETAHVPSRTMPGMYEILSGEVGVSLLRHVEIEDLLRREPVTTDMIAVTDLLRGKRVLVTGGGGSIGREMCRQVLRCGPAELIVLGHGENSIFEVTNELNGMLAKLRKENHFHEAISRVHPVIADVRFPDRLRAIFDERRPEIVFHTAAHKHVPLMEMNVAEAITNNVIGSRNLIQVSRASDVKHFVLISTDKAVNPTSIMGACKRVAELLTHQAALASDRPYVAVRFGNVLGSRGSVVLTFRKQLAAGGPITITDPNMQRYFMLIPEAVQLVLQAAVLGKSGEVFMLDMGKPVRIVDLAEDMIRLSGLELGHDVEIHFVGARPGEKLFEELFGPDENYRPTSHEKIFIAEKASTVMPPDLDGTLAILEAAAAKNDKPTIIQCLKKLVPEFQPEAGGGDSAPVWTEKVASEALAPSLPPAGTRKN